MATINLANKYEKKLDERFKLSSLTDAYAGHSYNFDGVNSITIYTIGSTSINDYNRNDSVNRFGKIEELGDTTQTLVMTQDRSYTFSIDYGNAGEQFNIKHCNAALKQIWDEEVVPEIDKYRFQTWANGAGTTIMNATELTEDTILQELLKAGAMMNNKKVPRGGRVIFVSETANIAARLNKQLAHNDSFTNKALVGNAVGTIDGSPVVVVPDFLFPAGVEFMIKYKGSTVDPMKRKVLRVQTHPLGFDADIGEGRFIHDSFVLDNKANGILVYGKSGMATQPTVTISGGTATMTAGSGETIKYTTDGTNPKTSKTAQTYNSSAKPTVTAGQTVKAYAYKSGALNSGIAEATA